MNWVKTILVLSLVCLWVPATLHCKLEELPGLQFLSCCDHGETAPHQDDDCETDACAMVEGGLYKSANPKVTILPPPVIVVRDLASRPEAELESARFRFRQLSEKSPDLPVTWQFSSRAALPPRAPSFVS